MNAVRSNVFKRKSMVTVLRPLSAVPLLPQEFLYDEVGLNLMTHAIITPGENTRVAVEAIGSYHKSGTSARHRYVISYLCSESVVH